MPSVAAVTLAYLAIATFPAEFRPIVPGLDPSWVYAINELPSTDAVHGRDVVFSFGPLGYLLVPMDIGSNLIQASVLWVVGQLALVGVLVYHARRSARLVPIVGFAALFILATSLGLLYEYRVLLLLGLLLTIPVEDRIAWRVASALAAALAAILVYTKLSSGLAALVMLGVAAASWMVQRRVRLRDLLLPVVLPLAAVILLLAFPLLRGPAGLVEWLRVSSQFTAGYSEAMSFPGPGVVEFLVGGGIVVYAGAAFLIGRWERSVAPAAAAFGILTLLAFRHGIVRHYGRFVPAIVIVALAALLLMVRSRASVVVGGVAAVLVSTLAFGMSAVEDCLCPWRPEALAPARGWNGLVSLVTLPETREGLAAESADRLSEDRLPDPVLAAIRAQGGSVDAIPWEIGFMPANDLLWEPNPVLQTYSAFTPDLDRRTGEHFASDEAPGSLLVQFVEIDKRHPMLGAPLMWRAILERYRPSGLPVSNGAWGQVALLQRRDQAISLDLRPMGSSSGRVGERVEIPQSAGLVFGSLRLRHDVGGRLAGLLWRIDPVLLDLELADGGIITVRFLPATAENGLLLNRLPMTLRELLDLYEGTFPRELVAIRVHGEGASSFEPGFDVRWFEGEWEEQSSGGPGAR